MNNTYFIGVDSGSQSTKVSIIDRNGTVVCSTTQPLRPMINRNAGWMEHPDDDLWDSLINALHQLISTFHGNPDNIRGVGLCSIRCCRVFLKSDGSLAAPVMSWMDVRAYETFHDAPEIAYTGSTSGYLTFRLTGSLTDTIANAHQDQFPVDMNRWQWSDDPKRFGSFNIPRDKLLEMHLPGEILGHVTADAAKATGLPEGIPVVATANDKAVEALGSGLVDNDTGLLSLGTYTTAMVFGSENRAETDTYFTNLSAIPYRYLYESNGIRGGMWHISWFKGIVGAEFSEEPEVDGATAEDRLEKEALPVPPGAEGLLIVPDWLAPASQLHKKGVMIGFDQRHTRGHIYRAFMEGISMRMKDNIDAMTHEIGVTPKKLIVCGGGSNSDLFMQIVADVFGMTASRNIVNGAAALGAAISVAVATGFYRDYYEAVRNMVHEKDAFPHNSARHETYTRINEGAYRKLTGLLDDPLKTIHRAYQGNT